MTEKDVKRRIGRFSISQELIKNWKSLLPIFAQVVIVRAESRYDLDTIEYIAFSELFEELVCWGELAPHYEFVLSKEPNGTVTVVEAIKTNL